MPKLKRLPPRLKPMPPRIGTAVGDKVAQDKQRNRINHWRSWYQTQRWRRLREAVLIRDAYICQRTGVICSGRHPAPNSPVANHKKPHRGNPDLFWDIDNIETVAKHVHDSLIQKEEQAMPGGIWD